jgi:predicted nucleotidyltransferase
MINNRFEMPKDRLVALCKKWKISELGLFGSVLTDNFRPDSDIDVLVTFVPDCRYSLLDLALIQQDMEKILGHKVDLIERKALQNPFRKKAILSSVETIYAA